MATHEVVDAAKGRGCRVSAEKNWSPLHWCHHSGDQQAALITSVQHALRKSQKENGTVYSARAIQHAITRQLANRIRAVRKLLKDAGDKNLLEYFLNTLSCYKNEKDLLY